MTKLCALRGLLDRHAGHFMKQRMEEYGGFSLGLQANGGPQLNRYDALGEFTLTYYCVELFPLLKCRKKRERFAIG